MGASSSTAERKACASVPESPHRLSERQAFDMATAWRHELTGFLLLDVDSHYPYPRPNYRQRSRSAPMVAKNPSADDMTILNHVEWIEFNLSTRCSDRIEWQDLMDAVHATTLAWFALSCCPGFAGHENPEFWKRVFSAFMRELPNARSANCYQQCPGVVTATQRFFEHPDRPFPRIRFAWFNELPIEMLWEAQLRTRDKLRLRRINRKLSPYIDHERSQRSIPVAIRVQRDEGGYGDETEELANRLRRMSLSHHVGSNASKLQLTAVDFSLARFSNDCVNAIARFPHARARVLKNTDDRYRDEDVSALKDIPSMLADLAAATVDTRALDVWFRIDSPWGLAATTLRKWCSALPHTPTASGVRCYVKGRIGHITMATAGAWLGYALFHPGLTTRAASSLEDVTLWLTHSHNGFVRSLQHMREGNNLLLAMGVATKVTSGYHKARVRGGAIIRASPNRVVKLHVFPREQWVTVCGVEAFKNCRDIPHQFVQIVLPGYGLAWVASQDILEVVCDAPASSRVTRLRLILDDYDRRVIVHNETIRLLLEVLSLLGAQLKYLHIELSERLQLDAITVHNILSRCPNLTSFRVAHDGSYWSGDLQTETPLDRPRLQELELSVPSKLQPLTAPQLNDLSVLNVKSPHSATCRGAVVSTLARYPRIRCFEWRAHDDVDEPGTTESYDTRCTEMWRQLAPNLAPGTIELAHPPLQLDARLAFLSVAASLPEEVLALIFTFSSSNARRRLYIYKGPRG